MLAGRRGRRIDFSCTVMLFMGGKLDYLHTQYHPNLLKVRREREYLEMRTGRMRKNYIEGHIEIPVYLEHESVEPWKVDK